MPCPLTNDLPLAVFFGLMDSCRDATPFRFGWDWGKSFGGGSGVRPAAGAQGSGLQNCIIYALMPA